MPTRLPFSFFGFLVISSTFTIGCGHCADEGCDYSVQVEFTPDLRAGEYRLEVAATSEPVACIFAIDGEGLVSLGGEDGEDGQGGSN